MKFKFRAYKTAKSVWGFGFGYSPSGPYLEFAKWVFCYEPTWEEYREAVWETYREDTREDGEHG